MADRTELTMSDDDFLDTYPEDFNSEEPSEVEEEHVETEDESAPVESDVEMDSETEEDDTSDLPLEDEADTDEEAESTEEDEQSESDDSETDADEEVDDSDEVDYKALHEQLLKPFKANGSEMQVENVDEAVKLMQMGANYTKKMTALKPNLKLMKMLDNNKLLDEESLNLMIDVAKGNPEAISKLVRDNKIDPLDLTSTEENKYTPKNYTVGDNEVELDDVISRIQDSPTFSDTMNVVSSKWDESSKRDIAGTPQQLEVIHTHVSNGTYAKVQSEMDRQRAFGGLSGLSDFEAYKQVGGVMFQEGKLALEGQEPPKNVVVKTAPKVKSDKPRKDKRKAASPSRNTGTAKVKQDFNPLSLSDADFENYKY
jgi:hypothetical protein